MNDLDPETIAVRPHEALDLSRLEPWLRRHLNGAEGPLALRQFGGGHANLTYLLRFGTREFVLRRPPPGPLAPSAHDMRREHRVLSRLWRAWELAPRSYLLCLDRDILGVDFHVMERRRGFVLRAAGPDAVGHDPALRRRIGEMAVDSLAALHAIDAEAVGLADLGRPEGFLGRQMAGWTRRWEAARDDAAPDARAVIDWLGERMPATSASALVHNDFKLDNILLARDDPARAVAVLDWDMCTRGDPLLDLANLTHYWSEEGDSDVWRLAASMPTDRPGFPSRAAMVRRYAARTGSDVRGFGWYEVFGAFRVAVILQQLHIRYLKGQTRDARFAALGRRVRASIAKCGELVAMARDQAPNRRRIPNGPPLRR